MGQKSNN